MPRVSPWAASGTHRYPEGGGFLTWPQRNGELGLSTAWIRPRRRAQHESGTKVFSVAQSFPQVVTASTKSREGLVMHKAPGPDERMPGMVVPVMSYPSS